MHSFENEFPIQRKAPFKEWSPSIHYAQFQRMPTGSLAERRIYDFELLYVGQGEAATTMRGQRYTLTAGQLIFLPSGVLHRNEAVSRPDTRFLGIHFDFFDELDIQTEADMIVNEAQVQAERFAYEAVSEDFQPLSQDPVYTPTLECVQLMEQLVHEFTMRPIGYELACKALMLNILSHLLRLQHARSRSLASQHDGKLLELIENIERNPEEPWSNAIIANRLNLSIDHAAKLFKQLVGLPPNEFVHTVRHREARRLLRETDLPIERIAERTGYSSIHYFSRLFRRAEGISATEYRKLSKVL
ncbi:helix-turn-helix domain-containing protein [Paenibacillus nanensis]|uniref:Helix-turn-helix domain-containing protein n=1 Tax=Paenibacillus nanensis TaxID=393251 RepID=A0A3A1UM33_9BACL|nr:helix-turn-helix domain-containing protein [Paenibacillus nanensis]RIX47270.1 helix-turn-helix domain-containing protein [Paenibacillus nanensis]